MTYTLVLIIKYIIGLSQNGITFLRCFMKRGTCIQKLKNGTQTQMYVHTHTCTLLEMPTLGGALHHDVQLRSTTLKLVKQ